MERTLTGENIVDLRDLEGEEKEAWKKAIEDEAGYTFSRVLDNEPTAIHETYFSDYAQELARDLWDFSDQDSWPYNHIDWEAAAEELQMNYTSFEVDGETYYFRAF